MRTKPFLLLMLLAVGAGAEEPTELYDCVNDADGPSFCTGDSTAVLVDEGCGATFNRYHGRIAWPVLRNVGPVIISVRTRAVIGLPTELPLYIEVRQAIPGCWVWGSAQVALVALGGVLCGGRWESVGPVDLMEFGVPLGELYTVQAVFLESIPGQFKYNSVGLNCIRVTSHPLAVAPATWSDIKVLYR